VRTRFTRLRAVAAPMRWVDVNTDDIFPAPASNPIVRHRGPAVVNDRSRIGECAFAAHRYTADGEPNPDFLLNRPPYDRAEILVAGSNFGCGSSREAAVWTLAGIGIRCIVAPSFGDIFRGNCYQNGLLPVQLTLEQVERCWTLAEGADPVFDVDLDSCTITPPDGDAIVFEVGEHQRRALLAGLDEIGATLEHLAAIEQHEAAYWARRPWLHPATPAVAAVR